METPVYAELRNKYSRTTSWDSKLLQEFYSDLLNVTFFENFRIDKKKLKEELLQMTGEHSFI